VPSRRWNYRRPSYNLVFNRTPSYLRRHRPHIYVNIQWPWVVRYQRHWQPRYRYRQVVYVETVVNGRPSRAQVEVETTYSHRVIQANDEYAEINVQIERLEIYENGRYLGHVEQIPAGLSDMTATVYKDGQVYFDREIFLVGDRYAGFEVLSTRAYDDYVLDAYHHSDGYRAGKVDLGSNRVRTIRSSRLFRPDRADGHVPISLLPNDEDWLWDFGVNAISAASDNYDVYYGASGRASDIDLGVEPFRQEDEWQYSAKSGAEIKFQRESQIQRVR
jgi:hypothetical protein